MLSYLPLLPQNQSVKGREKVEDGEFPVINNSESNIDTFLGEETPTLPGTQDDNVTNTTCQFQQNRLIMQTVLACEDTDSGVEGDNDADETSAVVLQSQQLHDDNGVQLTKTQQLEGVAQKSTSRSITYAMLKRVACELVEVAMKQNNEEKKVTVCGMMLRATNFLKGNELLGGAGFEEAVEQYLHSFSAHNPNLFSGETTTPVLLPAEGGVQAPGVIRCSGRPSTNRLQSRTEFFRRPKNGAPKQRSCGFCHEQDGHTVIQCPLMAQRGKQVLHCEKDQFCYGILDTFAVKQLNHRQHPDPTILIHLVGATHIAITSLHIAARNTSTAVVNKKKNRDVIGFQQVIAKVTLLGEGGNPLTGVTAPLSTANEFYTLTSVLSWISKSSSKKRVFHSLTQLSEVDAFQYQYT